MTIIGKLFLSLLPRSWTGAILYAIPVATAVVVVMYPKTIIAFFLPQESAHDIKDLLEEITGDDESSNSQSHRNTNNRRRRCRRRRDVKSEKGINTPKASITPASNNVLETSPAIIASPSVDPVLIDDDLLIRLASIKRMELGSTPTAIAHSPTAVQSPAFNAINLQEKSSMTGDDGVWNRVSTKEEETNASLRNRLATLNAQYGESEKTVGDLKNQLSKQTERANAAEAELKDRTRVYQLRWVEMESEINSLRTEKSNLLTRITETSSLVEAINGEKAKAEELLSRVHELEAAVSTVISLKKLVAAHEETESQYKDQISRLEEEMFKLVEEREELRKDMTKKLEEQSKTREDAILLKELVEKRLSETEEELEKIQNQNVELEDQITGLQEETGVLKTDLIKLEGQVKLLGKERDELTEQLAEMVSSDTNGDELKRLQALLAETQSQLEEKSQRVEKAIFDRIVDEKTAIEDKLAEKEQALASALANNSQIAEKLNNSEAMIAELNEKLQSTEGLFEELKGKLDSTTQELANLQQSLESSSSSSSSSSSQKTEQSSIIEEQARLRLELENTLRMMREKEEAIETLNKSLEASSSEKGWLRNELEEKSQSLVRATEELKMKGLEIELLRKELDTKPNPEANGQGETLKRLEAEITELKTALETAQKEKSTLEANVDRCDKRLRIVESVNEQRTRLFEKEITELRTQKEALEMRLNDFSKSNDIIEQLVTESVASQAAESSSSNFYPIEQ